MLLRRFDGVCSSPPEARNVFLASKRYEHHLGTAIYLARMHEACSYQQETFVASKHILSQTQIMAIDLSLWHRWDQRQVVNSLTLSTGRIVAFSATSFSQIMLHYRIPTSYEPNVCWTNGFD